MRFGGFWSLGLVLMVGSFYVGCRFGGLCGFCDTGFVRFWCVLPGFCGFWGFVVFDGFDDFAGWCNFVTFAFLVCLQFSFGLVIAFYVGAGWVGCGLHSAGFVVLCGVGGFSV